MYEEHIAVVSRDNPQQVLDALEAAEQEAAGYISRFDVTALLSRKDQDRDPILMMYIKDIAKWHFLNICNPGSDLNLAESRYDKAIAWLSKIQSGRIVPIGWPVPNSEDSSGSSFHIKSNTKRGNYY